MDPSASAYLDELTSSAADVLGDDLVGVYPHGSLMLGGWQPERSDIDVLVVVERSLSSAEQSALALAWSQESLPCPAVGLELSVVLRSEAAQPSARPAFELHVTTAPQDVKVLDGHGHPGDLDLVLHFGVCHALGYDVFPEVPHALVLAQVTEELTWAAEHNPSEYAVLNTCRAWRYAVDGALVSKLDGGRWAQERLDGLERAMVRTATTLQSGDEADPLDPSEVRAFALRIQDVIRSGRDENV